MARNPYEFLDRCHARLGDLFVLRLPGLPPLHVCADADGVKQLVAASYDTGERFGGGAEYFLGRRALICLQGEEHRQSRRLLNPLFTAERLRGYGAVMQEVTDELLATYRPGARLVMQEEMQTLTLRVMIRCIFGVTAGPREERLSSLVVAYLGSMFQPWLFALNMAIGPDRLRALIGAASARLDGLPAWLGDGVARLPLSAASRQQADLYALLDAEIARCKEESAQESGRPTGILQQLWHSRGSDAAELSPAYLRDQVLMLLVGGHETTATTLCWALHCLMQDRPARDRLRDELRQAGAESGELERLRDLPYLGAVIDESMRLYPIAPFVSRKLSRPLSIAGYDLPVGAHVNPCIYLVGRSAKNYPDPLRFAPERMRNHPPPITQAFPFGSGPWRCIGAAFAQHELRVVLSKLVSRWDLSPVPGVPIQPHMRWLTIAPTHGLPVLVNARAPR